MPTTLRIEGKGGTASGYRLFLNDEEVSNFTRAISLDMSVDDANVATLEVYVDRIDLSAEVEAELKYVDGRRIGDNEERTSFASKLREWIRG